MMDIHLKEKLGLVIDGTGKDFEKITNQANALRQVGYDCAMIFVNTNKETALQRNSTRDRVLILTKWYPKCGKKYKIILVSSATFLENLCM